MDNWTFTILKRTKTDDNTIEIVVGFDNGTKTFQRVFTATKQDLTRNWLDNQIKREVSIFENGKSFLQSIKEGTYTLKTFPQPTQEEIDKTAFVNLIIRLAKIQKLIELGILQEEDATAVRSEILSMDIPSLIDSTPIY